VAVLQIQRVLGRAVLGQITGCGHGHEFEVADTPRHQGLLGQLAATDHAVHVVTDQVHRAVAHAQVDLDVGVARLELGQPRNDEQACHGGAHIHAQAPARRGTRLAEAGFHIVEVGQQPHDTVVVGRAIGRDGDAAWCG
jgi:hypothetical protein